jgi:hypothetical protein
MSKLSEFIRLWTRPSKSNEFHNFIVIPELRVIARWNPKCGCSTLKKTFLMKLGHETNENIHVFIEKDHGANGEKHGIFALHSYLKKTKIDFDDYTKIIVVRDVYEKLISALIERSKNPTFHEAGYLNLTISEFILKLNDCKDAHFYPQTYRLPENFKFDYIINLNKFDFVKKLIGLEGSLEKEGSHNSSYSDNNDDYKSKPIHACFNQPDRSYNRNVDNYFTANDLKIINEYYRKDFLLLHSVNIGDALD